MTITKLGVFSFRKRFLFGILELSLVSNLIQFIKIPFIIFQYNSPNIYVLYFYKWYTHP
jgi:hypothetical protein